MLALIHFNLRQPDRSKLTSLSRSGSPVSHNVPIDTRELILVMRLGSGSAQVSKSHQDKMTAKVTGGLSHLNDLNRNVYHVSHPR